MKKMFIAIAMVSVAMFTNAASITWGLDTFTVPGTPPIASATAYFLLGDTAGVSTAIENGTFTTTFASSILDTGTTTPAGNMTGQVVDGLAYDTLDFYIVILTADGKYAISGVQSVKTSQGTDAAAKVAFGAGNLGAWKDVPEPATMALLGLGVVALGLRRRRK